MRMVRLTIRRRMRMMSDVLVLAALVIQLREGESARSTSDIKVVKVMTIIFMLLLIKRKIVNINILDNQAILFIFKCL